MIKILVDTLGGDKSPDVNIEGGITALNKNKDIHISVNTQDLQKQNCYTDKNVLKMVMSNLLENAIELITTGSININISNPLPEFLLSKGFEVGKEANEKSYLMFEVACKGLDSTAYNNSDILIFIQ